jgi:Tfp pilus assembly protein PilX
MNTWFIIVMILLVTMLGLDYYDYVYLQKQLTGNQAFAKSLMYIAMFNGINRMLK